MGHRKNNIFLYYLSLELLGAERQDHIVTINVNECISPCKEKSYRSDPKRASSGLQRWCVIVVSLLIQIRDSKSGISNENHCLNMEAKVKERLTDVRLGRESVWIHRL